MSGRSVDGCKVWVVGWVCGRGFCGYGFVEGVLLRYLDGVFLRRVNGCELGHHMDFSWKTLIGPRLGDLEGVLVREFRWTLAG